MSSEVKLNSALPAAAGRTFGLGRAESRRILEQECSPKLPESSGRDPEDPVRGNVEVLYVHCSNMVLNVIGAAGALKGEIVLNVWLGTRMPLKPQDIMAISRYLKGNKSVLILPELRS
jgi:hypothetical protein